MESLEIMLEKSTRKYTPEQRLAMATRKNDIYRELLKRLSPTDILPGVLDVLDELRNLGVRMAIGSSSKNAGPILKAVGLDKVFDVVVDGTHIERSKPDPEVFTLAAKRLGFSPAECLVVEDADAGVDAGLAAGMPVLAVGAATAHPRATIKAKDMTKISIDRMLTAA